MNIFVSGLLVLGVAFAISKYYLQHADKLGKVVSTLSRYLLPGGEASRAAKNAKMLSTVKVDLYDHDQVIENFGPETWQRQAFDSFAGTMTSKDTFPCIYGTKGFRSNELDYLFLDSEELADAEISKFAAKGILDYHEFAESRGKNISLVIFSPPPTVERTVDEYNTLFWKFLRRMREIDPKPWPKEVPKGTSEQFWCFNFDATQAFIGVLTPAHYQRRSRRCANLCMIYQPRWVFDILFSNEKTRKAATTTVRNLVDKYDLIPHSPDISDYAEPNTTESRQYFLMDENEPSPCPYPTL